MLQVLLWRGPISDPVQLAIRLWTGSEFTHSGLAYNGEVWEFTRWGFRRSPLSEYLKPYELWDFKDLTSEKRELMLRAMGDLSRRTGKYDWSAILGLAVGAFVAIIEKLVGRDLPDYNPFQHPDRFFCSEFVAFTASCAGYNHEKEPALVFPVDHTKVDWLSRAAA